MSLTLSNSTPPHTPHLGHRGEGIPPCTVPGLHTQEVAVLQLSIKRAPRVEHPTLSTNTKMIIHITCRKTADPLTVYHIWKCAIYSHPTLCTKYTQYAVHLGMYVCLPAIMEKRVPLGPFSPLSQSLISNVTSTLPIVAFSLTLTEGGGLTNTGGQSLKSST